MRILTDLELPEMDIPLAIKINDALDEETAKEFNAWFNQVLKAQDKKTENIIFDQIRTMLTNHSDVKIEGVYYFNKISVDTIIGLIKRVEINL